MQIKHEYLVRDDAHVAKMVKEFKECGRQEKLAIFSSVPSN